MGTFLEDNHGDDGKNLNALYTPWGNQASTAIGQGWKPETNQNGIITYRSGYDNAFNNIILPTQEGRGHIALIGYPNQKFDVVIRDKDGNVLNTIYKGISPQDVQTYLTNSQSSVAQRNNSIVQGRNRDKPDEQGNYVSNK